MREDSKKSFVVGKNFYSAEDEHGTVRVSLSKEDRKILFNNLRPEFIDKSKNTVTEGINKLSPETKLLRRKNKIDVRDVKTIYSIGNLSSRKKLKSKSREFELSDIDNSEFFELGVFGQIADIEAIEDLDTEVKINFKDVFILALPFVVLILVMFGIVLVVFKDKLISPNDTIEVIKNKFYDRSDNFNK